MKIVKFNEPGGSRTGTLSNITVNEITKILGFKPNCEDDKSKVKHSWGFKADNVPCGTWDYRGSEKYNRFSTDGPKEVFIKLFGDKYTTS